MNKVLQRDARSRSTISRGAIGVLENALWAGAPLGIGVCFAAASWGQIGWSPGVRLAALSTVCLCC